MSPRSPAWPSWAALQASRDTSLLMVFATYTAAVGSGRPVANFQSASAVVQSRRHLHALKAYLILTGQKAGEPTAAHAGYLRVLEEHAHVSGASMPGPRQARPQALICERPKREAAHIHATALARSRRRARGRNARTTERPQRKTNPVGSPPAGFASVTRRGGAKRSTPEGEARRG